jgi:hypothetical protein
MSGPLDPLYLDRSVLQIFPDNTDKIAVFETEHGSLRLEINGFASVMHLATDPHELPRIAVEPIVDEPDYGLITQSDLEHETGWQLLEIE